MVARLATATLCALALTACRDEPVAPDRTPVASVTRAWYVMRAAAGAPIPADLAPGIAVDGGWLALDSDHAATWVVAERRTDEAARYTTVGGTTMHATWARSGATLVLTAGTRADTATIVGDTVTLTQAVAGVGRVPFRFVR